MQETPSICLDGNPSVDGQITAGQNPREKSDALLNLPGVLPLSKSPGNLCNVLDILKEPNGCFFAKPTDQITRAAEPDSR